ncbi:MAG TPA: S53 family peptidase [Candidatus Obscuribacter sp.]|nr:S53 family peptidase [Candidatus Obscuribacter sp.]
MQKKISGKLLGGIIALVAIVSVCAWYFTGSGIGSFFGFRNSEVVLSGSTPDSVEDSSLVRHADPERRIEIVIGLNVRNEADLDNLLERQADPQSPDYLKFLSVDDFVRLYSPAQTDVDEVVKHLTLNGIRVKQIARNRLLVHAEGTVAQMERAFHVTINEYSYFAGTAGNATVKTFYSNDRDPSIPAHLKDVVVSVLGLNDLDRLQSRAVSPRNPTAKASQAALSPADVATAYNLPNENNRAGSRKLTGEGVTMAIVTAEGYNKSDVEGYWQHHGVKRNGRVIDVPVNGTTKEVNEETTLDLELMGSQILDADIYMYIAYDAKFVNFALAFNQMVVDNHASVMSVSWGLCERGTGWLMMKTENAIFKQAASQGIALFASSGDDGVYDCKEKKLRWEVDFPSSSPYVTAVGGTTLTIKDGARSSESAWDGSGGGISSHFTRPKWQDGKGVPSGDKRVSADVSMVADPSTGYSLYYDGKWAKIGGTSASGPQWAALWGLSVQAVGKRLGPANSHIYRAGRSSDAGKIFFDVVTGMNGAGRGPGYKAAPGWDYPTGWGAPDGEALIRHLEGVNKTTK